MSRSVVEGLKRFILWDYPRAGWQYDVMVALILAFIFLTPRSWFRDQPRVPRASRIAALPSDRGTMLFWIEAELLAGVAEPEQLQRARELLSFQTGEKVNLVRLEPVLDSDEEIQGYIAFAAPNERVTHAVP